MFKWRCETYHPVFHQLNLIRDICETYLIGVKEILRNCQEGELLSRVAEACSWKELGFHRCVSQCHTEPHPPIEHARHWGLVCNCPDHQALREAMRTGLLRFKRIECVRNSRRLHEARKFLFNLVTDLATKGRQMHLADCNDIYWIALEIAGCQRSVSAELGRTWGFS